jgi:hypothetical protein
MIEAGKTYIGVVEDNQDPERTGRVKVRVMGIFDNFDIESIPWATPWKDLNGNNFNLPERGKVVIVVFDQGNPDSPEFIYTEHYNINLESKLKSLSDSDYTSMKSLIFDHKTQIYVNDSEGLKIDHKYNNINITGNGLDINLKDNKSTINIGDSSANQQAILGNNWMDWFDEFVENLLGEKAGPFLGNLGAPVLPAPNMVKSLLKYKKMRNSSFLSKNVNIVDNGKINSVLGSDREDKPQYGDVWSSTIIDNNITSLKTSDDFSPEEPEDIDPDIERVITYIRNKGFKLNEDIGILNILAIRNKDNGFITNRFDDNLYVVWKKDNGKWSIMEALITTVPGYLENNFILKANETILTTAQYFDKLELYENGDDSYLYFKDCFVYLNRFNLNKYSWNSEIISASGVKIIPGDKAGIIDEVFQSAEGGAQVFKSYTDYKKFIKICRQQVIKYGKKSFTYTLALKSDFDNTLDN